MQIDQDKMQLLVKNVCLPGARFNGEWIIVDEGDALHFDCCCCIFTVDWQSYAFSMIVIWITLTTTTTTIIFTNTKVYIFLVQN